jgi:hypothetical protein
MNANLTFTIFLRLKNIFLQQSDGYAEPYLLFLRPGEKTGSGDREAVPQVSPAHTGDRRKECSQAATTRTPAVHDCLLSGWLMATPMFSAVIFGSRWLPYRSHAGMKRCSSKIAMMMRRMNRVRGRRYRGKADQVTKRLGDRR